MKDFADKAEEAIPCVRVEDADGTAYRVTEQGLKPADSIGSDEFPMYGDWLPCEAIDANGKALGDRYLEAPGALAAELVRLDAEVGTAFKISEATKTETDQWQIELEAV